MKNYFEEKTTQISPGTIDAFGIEISSRYSKADEMIEMLEYTNKLAKENISHYIKKLFYDSKATICSIEVNDSVLENDPIGVRIKAIAKDTLSHFMLFDNVDGIGYDN